MRHKFSCFVPVVIALTFNAFHCPAQYLLLPQDFNNSVLSAVPCIREYFRIFFSFGLSLSGSIVTVSIDPDDPLVQQRLLWELHNDQDYKWTIMMKNPKTESEIKYESEDKSKNYLMFLSNMEDVTTIVTQWKSASQWNPLAPVLCLFTEEMTSEVIQENSAMVLSLLLESNVLNANILSKSDEDDAVQVSTIFPYENDSCADIVTNVRSVGLCEYEDTENNTEFGDNILSLTGRQNLMPIKFPNNLHGCPLKVSARVYEPYAMYDEETSLEIGIDVLLTKTVAQFLGMNLMLEFPNQTLFYVYQDLIESEINLIIGGVDEDPGISELLSSTIPYYQDDLTWCVAKAGHLAQWRSIFSLFDLKSWCIIAGTVFCSSVILFLLARAKEHITYPPVMLSTYAIILSHSINLLVYRWSSIRIFLMCYIIFALIFNTVYQTFLISVLTNPRREIQISTVQQIYEHNLDVTGGVEIIRHITKNDTLSSYLRKKMIICYDLEKCLRELEFNKLLAVAISREHVLNNPRIKKGSLFCFPRSENIYSYLVSILSTKDYHLLEKFNRIIRYITEAGLVHKWKNDVNFVVTLKEEYGKVEEASEKSLSVEHLYGAFLLYFVLIALSILVFFFEKAIHSMVRKYKRSRPKKRVEKGTKKN